MNTSSFSGKRLIEERKRLGYKSQAAAAKKCGVSGRMWGDYERGVSQPKAEQLFQFEKAGIDIDYVMHGVRHTERPSEAFSDGHAPEEAELLALFRQSSGFGRALILAAARGAEKKAGEDNLVSATHKTA